MFIHIKTNQSFSSRTSPRVFTNPNLVRTFLITDKTTALVKMGKQTQKQKRDAVQLGPDSDPRVLYNSYLQACKAIGIQPYPPLKQALTNEENPNRGKQIIIVGGSPHHSASNSMDSSVVLGPGGCRALVNAMIGKVHPSTKAQTPFTATKEIRICRSNIKDGGAVAIASLLFATAGKLCINTSLEAEAAAWAEWKLEYLELIDNDIGRSGAMALGRSLSVGVRYLFHTFLVMK